MVIQLETAAGGHMIENTIEKIERKLKHNPGMNAEAKAELLGLLAELRGEIDSLAETDAERAQTVAGFTEVSTHEAMRARRDPQLVELSVKGLSRSVEEFEGSHPQLVAVVNRICTTLSNMGI